MFKRQKGIESVGMGGGGVGWGLKKPWTKMGLKLRRLLEGEILRKGIRSKEGSDKESRKRVNKKENKNQ